MREFGDPKRRQRRVLGRLDDHRATGVNAGPIFQASISSAGNRAGRIRTTPIGSRTIIVSALEPAGAVLS